MKVTVTFGQTGVVVPCKEGWTVRDLIQQATQRYRKLLEQVLWRSLQSTCLSLQLGLIAVLAREVTLLFNTLNAAHLYTVTVAKIAAAEKYVFVSDTP